MTAFKQLWPIFNFYLSSLFNHAMICNSTNELFTKKKVATNVLSTNVAKNVNYLLAHLAS